MRYFVILALWPSWALSWEFTQDKLCRLTHDNGAAQISISYDPALPLYELRITLGDGTWATDPSFQMQFTGGAAISIGTTQHRLGDGGATLSVTDRGFGNVLNGIEFNTQLTATSGATRIQADTTTAGPALRAFRACPTAPPPLS